MARIDQRHPGNAEGDWFVDTRCIDCGTCRELAPALFDIDADGSLSIVARQPTRETEVRDAWRAAFACPTQSIGTARERATRARDPYPEALGHDVYALGHNSEDSYGADSYLAVRADGNLLIDSPRYTPSMAARVEALGGIAHVLLTHRDDVADAARFADRFGARVWIHEHDVRAAPFATDVLRGTDPTVVARGVVAIPVPGHTRGSVVYIVDNTVCFSGDSLAWSHQRNSLIAFRYACWFDWDTQLRSLDSLSRVSSFSLLLPGHGARVELSAVVMLDALTAFLARERSVC